METKEQTCKERVDKHLQSTLENIREMFEKEKTDKDYDLFSAFFNGAKEKSNKNE